MSFGLLERRKKKFLERSDLPNFEFCLQPEPASTGHLIALTLSQLVINRAINNPAAKEQKNLFNSRMQMQSSILMESWRVIGEDCQFGIWQRAELWSWWFHFTSSFGAQIEQTNIEWFHSESPVSGCYLTIKSNQVCDKALLVSSGWHWQRWIRGEMLLTIASLKPPQQPPPPPHNVRLSDHAKKAEPVAICSRRRLQKAGSTHTHKTHL